jgi:hypothetical protein
MKGMICQSSLRSNFFVAPASKPCVSTSPARTSMAVSAGTFFSSIILPGRIGSESKPRGYAGPQTPDKALFPKPLLIVSYQTLLSIGACQRRTAYMVQACEIAWMSWYQFQVCGTNLIRLPSSVAILRERLSCVTVFWSCVAVESVAILSGQI